VGFKPTLVSDPGFSIHPGISGAPFSAAVELFKGVLRKQRAKLRISLCEADEIKLDFSCAC
jgi:hypothetical protein